MSLGIELITKASLSSLYEPSITDSPHHGLISITFNKLSTKVLHAHSSAFGRGHTVMYATLLVLLATERTRSKQVRGAVGYSCYISILCPASSHRELWGEIVAATNSSVRGNCHCLWLAG